MPEVEWVKARCPECGEEYEYPKGGYKPATCSKYECLHRHLHPELKKGGENVRR